MKYLLLISMLLSVPAFAVDPIGTSIELPQDKQKVLKGTIEREQFVNKAGKPIKGVYDYAFKVKGKSYHINLHESSVTEAEMKQLIGEKIKVSASIKDGLWDTDDPNVQSRVGEYIVLHDVL